MPFARRCRASSEARLSPLAFGKSLPISLREVLQLLGFLALHSAADHRFAAVPGPPPLKRRIADLQGLQHCCQILARVAHRILLTADENGGAGTVSRRSTMAAHNRAVLCEGTIGATAPITTPSERGSRVARQPGDRCGSAIDRAILSGSGSMRARVAPFEESSPSRMVPNRCFCGRYQAFATRWRK